MQDSKTNLGGRNGSDYQDYVLQFNPDDESWTQVGKLRFARGWHGASLVQVEDVIDVGINNNLYSIPSLKYGVSI